MKAGWRIMTVAAALVLAAAITTSAQDRERGGPPPGPPPGPPNPVLGFTGGLLRELDLTAEQRTQVHTRIQQAMDGELGRLAREFGEARHALEITVWNPEATQADIETASTIVAEKSRALEVARHGLATEILSMLTDEQRSMFRDRLAEGPPFPPGPPPSPGTPGRHRGR